MKRRKPYWIKRFDQRRRGSTLRAILHITDSSLLPTASQAAKNRPARCGNAGASAFAGPPVRPLEFYAAKILAETIRVLPMCKTIDGIQTIDDDR
jgi:hypothetical protein